METYKEVEIYLKNKQVYFRKEITNSDFKTIAERGKVYNVGRVEASKLGDRTTSLNIVINSVETTIYTEIKDKEFFNWIKTIFIPVSILVDNYYKLKP